MGANAQTSVPTFTAGEILTAANMNISARTGIPVFADSTARDAAFGGTGEKTLAEGQFAYLESTNATQYYDGSTWQAVGTTPGLVCVKAETTFTAVSSLTVDSVFSSTYTNYFMTFIWSNSASANNFVKMRVGGVAASTNYNRNRIYSVSAGLGNELDTAQTSGRITGGSTATAAAGMFIYRPFVAAATIWLNQFETADGGTHELVNITHTTATAYDGFEITPSAGTITGSYAIYGYSKTV